MAPVTVATRGPLHDCAPDVPGLVTQARRQPIAVVVGGAVAGAGCRASATSQRAPKVQVSSLALDVELWRGTRVWGCLVRGQVQAGGNTNKQ